MLAMATRSRRVVFLAVAVFFLVGIYIVEQRPHGPNERAHLLTSIHDIMAGHSAVTPLPKTSNAGAVARPPAEKQPERVHEMDPCTVFSPLKGFIDLRGLSSLGNEGRAQAWHTRAFDLGLNFTVGVCTLPVKKLSVGTASVRDGLNITEIGAYYVDPENQQFVLMGEVSSAAVFNGRRLTLTYSNGSYCDAIRYANGERVRRKTILSFTCDREMLTKAHVSYVTAVDDCTYLFEVRSHYACPTAAKADNLAALWIFVLIFLAALLVYFSGGFLYRNLKRTPKPPKA